MSEPGSLAACWRRAKMTKLGMFDEVVEPGQQFDRKLVYAASFTKAGVSSLAGSPRLRLRRKV